MDVFKVDLSDMHSGSSRALFQARPFTTRSGVLLQQSSLQKTLYEHWVACANYVKAGRQGKRLVIVHNGDAIDGDHHNSHELMTRNPKEQADIHIELMRQFLSIVEYDHSKGDKIYYTLGTEVHTGEDEHNIAEELGAEKADDGEPVGNVIRMEINGRMIWYAHHGKSAGYGVNEGEALRNQLKQVFFDCLTSNQRVPDMIYTAHTHKPIYNTFVRDFHTIHGVITPSWQQKTRYAKKVAPWDKCEIGISTSEISASGAIVVHKPFTIETDFIHKVKL